MRFIYQWLFLMLILTLIGCQAKPITEGASYTACGCGCCGGIEPMVKCLEEGKTVQDVRAEDEWIAAESACHLMGCSQGVKYVECA